MGGQLDGNFIDYLLVVNKFLSLSLSPLMTRLRHSDFQPETQPNVSIKCMQKCQEGGFYCPDSASLLYYKGSASLNGTIKLSVCA